jgi:hypothetical protein
LQSQDILLLYISVILFSYMFSSFQMFSHFFIGVAFSYYLTNETFSLSVTSFFRFIFWIPNPKHLSSRLERPSIFFSR